jgi:hypothetical protein
MGNAATGQLVLGLQEPMPPFRARRNRLRGLYLKDPDGRRLVLLLERDTDLLARSDHLRV